MIAISVSVPQRIKISHFLYQLLSFYIFWVVHKRCIWAQWEKKHYHEFHQFAPEIYFVKSCQDLYLESATCVKQLIRISHE